MGCRSKVVLTAIVLLAAGCRRVDEPAPTTRRATPAPAAEPSKTIDTNVPIGTTMVVPDFARVAAGLGPCVVSVISTVHSREGDRGNRVVRGLGSGMIVSTSGQVLTNEHVVADASAVEVELDRGRRAPARVVVADPLLDLALLEMSGTFDDLKPVEFREQPPTPGEWIMAVGQPFGLGHTVTVGVIGGLNRDYADLGRPPGLKPDGIWSFIQTDASINIGNSGGPLVDPDGKVVGITTAVRQDGQGLAFAIPAAMARRFLEEAWTYRRIRHARLGIRAEDAGPEVMPGRARTIRVTAVDAGGPGAKAGLQPGDLILEINGEPVGRVSEVAYLAQLLGVGARLSVTIKRGDAVAEQRLLIPAEGSAPP